MYRKTIALITLIAAIWAFVPQQADACHRKHKGGAVVAETACVPAYGAYPTPSYNTMPYSSGYANPGYSYGPGYNSPGVGVGVGVGYGGYGGYGREGYYGGGFEGGRGYGDRGMYPHR